MRERVVVLDFGGQYNQLIARRVREAGVYSELIPHDAPLDRIQGESLSAIILTGGPDSAYVEGAKACDNAIFSLGVPVLGICYGMQYLAKVFGGEIASADVREYGHTKISFQSHSLFRGMGDVVWMNHNDSVTVAPTLGFPQLLPQMLARLPRLRTRRESYTAFSFMRK